MEVVDSEKESPVLPVTPRKTHNVVNQAIWTPAQKIKEVSTPLENYALGDCLGRGASAFVYKALNLSTGSTVAIKRIKVESPSAGGIDAIMMEIDLLKNLNHPNIVKYHGFIRSGNTLNIILEYCENGSLTNICRKFGRFPETLVAVYIAQVLDGLAYLHDQGTIHRDIKGANILTTKDGNAKLADFGVATRINKFVNSKNTVAGTPYWMAPEVIELNGATTAADIWSVGCTVVELLTGNPPFYNIEPIPAMFAIVHEDQPPLPKGISSQLQDFLMQCFRKDPLIRPTAKKLLVHPWIIQNQSRSAVSGKRFEDATTLQSHRQHLYDQTVKTVQAWNNKKTIYSSKSPKKCLKKKESQYLRQRKKLVPTDLNRFKEDNDISDYSQSFDPTKNGLQNSSGYQYEGTIKSTQPKGEPVDWTEKENEDYGDIEGIINLERLQKIVKTKSYAKVCFPSEPFKTVSKESIAVTQTPASQTPRRVNIEPPKTGVALLSFAETNDDEDYTGEFDIKPDILSNSHGHNSVEDLHLVHRTEYSQDDVFAEMEDETFPTLCGRDDSYNRNVAAADFQMEKLMSKLTKNVQTLSSEELNSLISEVLELLVNYEFTRKQVISLHGLSAMLEVLSDQSIQNDPHEEVIENILHCVSEVIIENFQVLENFCLVGGISLVCYFVSKKFRYSVRYQSVIIIDLLCQSSDVSLQSFLSCGGLGILAMLLEEDYFEHSEFNIVSTSALWKLFNLKGSTSRNDICRVLARRGVLGHLSYILIKLILERERGKDPKVKHNSSHSKLSEGNAVVEKDFDQLIQEIVEILVNCSQTTSEIKAMMASRQVFIRVFKCYSRLNKVQQIMVLKFVKNFSSVESNFQLLQNSNAIEKLVYILEKSRKDEQRYKDVSSQILPTMFNLCRLSTSRQEEAALAGLVPHLQLLAKGNSPLKQFSLPILCDLAHNGRACRNILWKHHVLSSYLYLVSDPNWQTNAYEAIGSWLQDDTSQIEQKLTESGACSQLVSGISKAKSEDYNGVLESFLRILLQSQKICRSLPLPDLCFRIKRLLQHSKPVVRLGLLKILKTVFKFNPDRTYLLLEMKDILQPLASTSESVLVKQLAIELLSKINTKK